MEPFSEDILSPPLLDPGEWEAVRTLWIGAVCTVEEIRLRPIGQLAVLKHMHPEHRADPGIAARCVNEGLILQFLQQEGGGIHVPTLLAMGVLPNGCPALILAPLGESLADVLDGETLSSDRENTSVSLLLRVGIDLAEALGFVHARGVVHRDVRPENILFARRTCKKPSSLGSPAHLVDFGLAKVFRPGLFLPVSTGNDDILGTDLYMAPEQWETAKHVSGAADVYSLGVVLYRLASGRPPFLDPRRQVLMYQHLVTPPPALPNTLPPTLSRLIFAMLSKRAKDRPTASECARTLVALR